MYSTILPLSPSVHSLQQGPKVPEHHSALEHQVVLDYQQLPKGKKPLLLKRTTLITSVRCCPQISNEYLQSFQRFRHGHFDQVGLEVPKR